MDEHSSLHEGAIVEGAAYDRMRSEVGLINAKQDKAEQAKDEWDQHPSGAPAELDAAPGERDNNRGRSCHNDRISSAHELAQSANRKK